jgi:hypothetical protein
MGKKAGDECQQVFRMVSFFREEGSRSMLIAIIQEPFGDDMIFTPLEMHCPALPGAEEGYPGRTKKCEGIARSRSRCPLADYDASWPGSVIKHSSICTLPTR